MMSDFIAYMTSPTMIAYMGIVSVVFVGLQLMAAVMVYAERKVAAFMQQRYGPYLVGPKGLLQPIADIVKLFFKEELRPKAADAFLFSLAPIISVTAAFLAFAPVPFGAPTDFFGWLPEKIAAAGLRRQRRGAGDLRRRVDGRLRHRARRLGEQLEVLAARRPAQLGADDQLRAGLRHGAGHRGDVCRVAVAAGDRRRAAGLLVRVHPARGTSSRSSIGFFVFACAGIAETNRAPFDFPEAEQELVAGYHTEYSSMRFAMFFMAEYINMVTVSAVAANLYLGGWHGPFIPPEYGWIWFVIKLAFLLFVYLWLRWTLPRFRYDQLMSFGWKVLLPLATVNLILTAAAVLYFGL